jgi:hypothetical protein
VRNGESLVSTSEASGCYTGRHKNSFNLGLYVGGIFNETLVLAVVFGERNP